MVWLAVVLILIGAVFSWTYRFHLFSFYTYLSVQFEHRGKNFQLLSSLRENLVHERKKKIAGLEMILSSWERGDEIQPKYEYFEELLEQLKDLVRVERRNLMATTEDIWLWGKLWSMLLKIEKASMEKREKFDVAAVRGVLVRFTELTDQVVQSATQRFSFSLNDVVRESVKTVRVEKSQAAGISIEEKLEDAGENVRFSYDNFRQWQRVLTNLIRNAFEAVEAKQSGAGGLGFAAVPPLAGRGGDESLWVKVSTRESEKQGGQAGMPDLPEIFVPVSVIIEDSGIGMDEATMATFYKKGFTSGKEGGLGLGVSEESVQLIDQHGNWEVESRKGVGTKITINIDREKAKKAELILPPPKSFLRTKLAFGLYLFLLALIGLALLFTFDKYSRFWVDWNPARAIVDEANGKWLLVLNSGGKELWSKQFARRIPTGKSRQAVWIADIDVEGKNEVIVGFLESESETGYLLCFDFKGDSLWKFLLGKPGIYGKKGGLYSPSSEIFVEDVDQDREIEIVMGANCKTYYPCQLIVLDMHGRLEGEYWHSGHVAIQFIKDIDNDGEMEIVVGGVNNSLGKSPVAFVLDGKKVKGQSPPYSSKVLPKGEEEIYIRIPRIVESPHKIGEYPSAGLHYIGKRDGWYEYGLTVADYTEPDRGRVGRLYSVDQSLNPRHLFIPGFFRDKWAELRQRGLLSYDITPELEKKMMNFERWENGVKVK